MHHLAHAPIPGVSTGCRSSYFSAVRLPPPQVYTLDDFVAHQADHKAEVEGRLAQFHQDTFGTVLQACRSVACCTTCRLWVKGECEGTGSRGCWRV